MRRAIGVAAAIGVLVVGALVFLSLGRWLTAVDPERRVDLLVVAGGDVDHGLPSAVSRLERGLADRVWVLAGPPGPVLRERAAVRAYAERRGVGDRVRVIGSAGSMREQAGLVARELGADAGSLAVVTSSWQTTRARITFDRQLGMGTEVLAWSNGAPYRPDRWWREDPETTLVEAVKLGGTLALFGARPVDERQSVPLGLPVRALLGGFVGALIVGGLCRPLARRLGLVARPRLFRLHTVPVPLLGGVAVLGGLGTGMLAGGGFAVGAAGGVAAAGVAALALVGFADDLVGLGVRSRLLWAGSAAGAAWLLGLRAQVVQPGPVWATLINGAVTIVWFVGITHALNVLDNVDGAAAGVGAASAAAIAAVGISSGQWVVAVAAAALCGGCLGYLAHNIHPARLFMGDLGSLAIGFALAALGMGMRPAQEPPVSLAVAACVLGVPIFDVALVTVSRLRAGRPVSVGGTDHTAHRLIARGLSVRQASGVLWGAQIVLGVTAFVIAVGGRPLGWALALLVGAAAVLALRGMLRLPPWRTEAPSGTSEDLVERIDDALQSLRRLAHRARAAGLDGSDPTMLRSVEEALATMERSRRMLADNADVSAEGRPPG